MKSVTTMTYCRSETTEWVATLGKASFEFEPIAEAVVYLGIFQFNHNRSSR